MKQYVFPIDLYQAQEMFKPIRSKSDVISLLMKSVKLMMLPPIPISNPVGTIILKVSKMSRLFFVTDDKIFSFNFPFVVIANDECLIFRSIHSSEINSMIASQVLSVLDSTDSFENPEVLIFAESISDFCQFDANFWSIFRDLLMHEDGYIRYDCDEVRNNGHLHPLHHLDVFYSSGNTFKLGVKNKISAEHFLDVLDVSTNCHYVMPMA